MDGEENSCSECARTCCFVHRTELSSAVTVTSFFKIMFGDDFSRVLFLPQRFACTVTELVGQEATLEDSCGQIWEVMISKIDDSVVFQKGWNDFALDHDLVVGDVVLFFRTRKSHFLVKIYNRTSCEKFVFSARVSERKRKRDTLCSKGSDFTSSETDKSSIEKKCSGLPFRTNLEMNGVVKEPIISQDSIIRNGLIDKSGSVSKSKYGEEMEWAINLDSHETRRDERTCFLDLSVFEVSGVEGKKIPLVDVDRVAEARASEVVLSDAFDHGKSGSNSDKDSSNHSRPRQSTTCTVNREEDGGIVSTMLKKEVKKECQIEKNQVSLSQKCGFANDNGLSAKKEFDRNSGSSSIPISVSKKACQSVETMKVIKEEPINIKPSLCGQESIKELYGESSKATDRALLKRVSLIKKEKDEVHPGVKTEVIDMIDNFPVTTCRTHFSPLLATCNQSFVELPKRLPYPTIKGMSNVERKIVILRDQEKRLWPVMYHDKPSLQFLATGWEAFRKANCINSGDQCLFTVEDESDGIYSVSAVQR